MHRLALAAALSASLLLAGCGTLRSSDTLLNVADRLYLGGSSPAGPISEADWDAFVAEVVTPRFPEGLTLWRAQGQWREQDGQLTREPVLIIEVLHPGMASDDRRIEEIAEAYRSRFNQDAVLRSTARVRGRFVR